jgi:hypothetical protein
MNTPDPPAAATLPAPRAKPDPEQPTAWIAISEAEYVNLADLRRVTIGGDKSVSVEFTNADKHTYPDAADRFLDAIGQRPGQQPAGEALP